MFWFVMKELTIDNQGWSYFSPHEMKSDGIGFYISLKSHFELQLKMSYPKQEVYHEM